MLLFLKMTPLLDVIVMVIASSPGSPFAPVAPVIALLQVNFFVKVWLLQVKVSVMSPDITEAPPSVPLAATEMTRLPSAEAVAAVFELFVIPLGSVGSASVHAARLVPIYPANGIVIVCAALTRPPRVQGMETASLPHTTLVAEVPVAPLMLLT